MNIDQFPIEQSYDGVDCMYVKPCVRYTCGSSPCLHARAYCYEPMVASFHSIAELRDLLRAHILSDHPEVELSD